VSNLGTAWQKLKLKLLGLISPHKKFKHLANQQLQHEQQLISSLLGKKIPTWRQFRYLTKILNPREKIIIRHLASLITLCTLVLIVSFYLQNSTTIPASGGEYAEGLIGSPRYLNPLLANSNDVDLDLSSLIFSGLLKRDNQKNLVTDLADNYEISADQKTYTFHLRSNVLWHNGQKFSADDVMFTFALLQDPQVKSPLYRTFKGVTLERVDNYTIKFILKEPYTPFLQTLTFGILPQSLWSNVSINNLALTEFNLRPVGTGAWQFKSLTRDAEGNIKNLTLTRFENYYQTKPFLKNLIFKFYSTHAEAIEALKSNNIKGISFVPREEKRQLTDYKNINLWKLNLPQYTAVFFNLKSGTILEQKEIRQALNLAVDKERIIREVLSGDAEVINSPILPGFLGYLQPANEEIFNPTRAAEILQKAGWKKQEVGWRKKDKQELQITLTATEQTESAKTAEIIKQNWESLGVKTTLNLIPLNRLQKEIINTRAYEALLLGEVVGADPDPFAFWHSSQIDPPGLNLAGFANRTADQLIEQARQTTDKALRDKLYKDFQVILKANYSAVFLYSPLYFYAQNEQLKGFAVKGIIMPADRFSNLSDWYVKTGKKLW